MDLGLEGGFAEPVLQSQACFRAVMNALANPGTAQKLVPSVSTCGRMTPELVSVLLTLTDHDTSIWLDNAMRTDEAVLDYVRFHTGAPVTAEPGRATLAFATSTTPLPRLAAFNLGSQEYPDRSTTLVLSVAALSGGDVMVTRGPGVKGEGHISPVGLPGDFLAQWAANRELFPRGIDLLLVANGEVLGLPRSTRLTEGH